MGFSVPTSQPAAPSYLNPPNAIRSTTTDSILQLDRYCFATRRNVIASLSKTKTSATTGVQRFNFDVQTSKNSNGKIWCVLVGSDLEVYITTPYGSLFLPLYGGVTANADLLTGMPSATFINVDVYIVSLNGPPFTDTMRGLYLVEEILEETDLPS